MVQGYYVSNIVSSQTEHTIPVTSNTVTHVILTVLTFSFNCVTLMQCCCY